MRRTRTKSSSRQILFPLFLLISLWMIQGKRFWLIFSTSWPKIWVMRRVWVIFSRKMRKRVHYRTNKIGSYFWNVFGISSKNFDKFNIILGEMLEMFVEISLRRHFLHNLLELLDLSPFRHFEWTSLLNVLGDNGFSPILQKSIFGWRCWGLENRFLTFSLTSTVPEGLT